MSIGALIRQPEEGRGSGAERSDQQDQVDDLMTRQEDLAAPHHALQLGPRDERAGERHQHPNHQECQWRGRWN